MSAEDYKAGFRNGFDAGRSVAVKDAQNIRDALTALASTPGIHKRPLVPLERRCDCGHADTTHNELGYCQAGTRTLKECHCVAFTRHTIHATKEETL